MVWLRRNNKTLRPYGPVCMHRAVKDERWKPINGHTKVDDVSLPGRVCLGELQKPPSICIHAEELFLSILFLLPLRRNRAGDVVACNRRPADGSSASPCTVAPPLRLCTLHIVGYPP
eukprot:gene2243-biopygen1311